MKIERTEVYGFRAALHGARNPMNSWHLSDSYTRLSFDLLHNKNSNIEGFILGKADKALAQKLTKAGSEHSKFLRQIHVWVDLELPRYIWSEFDTYKYNTKNSCSSMHTLHRRELIQEDFESPILESTLEGINSLIRAREAKEITSDEFIHTAKNNLPDGFLQKRTVDTNYAELLNIYFQRHQHRLSQWHVICAWIEQLPYFVELTNLYELLEDKKSK
jgi:hypothetical protein